MSKLTALRTQLGRLRGSRQRLRWSTALAGWLLALVWLVVGAFLLDWLGEIPPLGRIALWGGLILGAYFSFQAWARPFFGKRETDLDMALLVEKHQGIDSDLVAALQFENGQFENGQIENDKAKSWGSSQLQTAVIDYVAEFGRQWDVFAGLSRKQLWQRAGWLVASVLVVGLMVAVFPEFARAFVSRMCLAGTHYPTNTHIDAVQVNGQGVYAAGTTPPKLIRTPYGQPVKFNVTVSGSMPQTALLRLEPRDGSGQVPLELTPVANLKGTYQGELPRLLGPLDYMVFAGDAWTDPAPLEVILQPQVDLALAPTPPKYALDQVQPEDAPPGARNIAVIEGSSVDLTLKSNKPLKTATLTLDETAFALEAVGTDKLSWKLANPETPLARVIEPVQFQLQVLDEDGLALTQPLQGFIRLKADRQPRVTAGMITQVVTPTAVPTVAYGARDDFGLSHLRLHREVVSAAGDERKDTIEVPLEGAWPKLQQSRLSVPLSGMKLKPGDQVKLTLEAVDYRGSTAGKSAFSDPLMLQVTDERGVIAAMAENEQRSASHLDAIIERQLGIGETR